MRTAIHPTKFPKVVASTAAPESHVPLNFDMRSSGVCRVRRASFVTRHKTTYKMLGYGISA
uniref:Uncharacterized protein n=1 Tax=Candidatus Kentrum sp. DK TaxID=2126562 RepID=A0A450SYY7_9GAMM|nr:MAG: hypothetical protein BECKDK2373C_GA0170839_107136 [Candidatus Kentron sp. DK]